MAGLVLTSVLLLLVFVACGGDEPRTVAPPPAPPPFQPQRIGVALGAAKQSITLMTTEAGGFTLKRDPVNSGDTHTVSNGNGAWTATFAPESTDVAPGNSAQGIPLMEVEAGGSTYEDTMLSDGAYAMAAKGAIYSIVMGEDDVPKATYRPQPVIVHLGALGGTITLFLQEDQMTWLLEGETEPFTSGRVISVDSIGNTYTVTLGEDGVWTAVYNEVEVTVALGTSGDVVKLIRNEMGEWRTDPDTPIQTGDTRTAANGNTYRLTFGGGEWTDTYVPVTKEIPGTGLTAVRNEDQAAEPGYHVLEDPDQKLDANGVGTVMSPAGNFRVHMDANGNLVAPALRSASQRQE